MVVHTFQGFEISSHSCHNDGLIFTTKLINEKFADISGVIDERCSLVVGKLVVSYLERTRFKASLAMSRTSV